MNSDSGVENTSTNTSEETPDTTEVQHLNNDDAARRLEALEQQQVVLQLMNDPDVQKIFNARRQGRAIEVVERSTGGDGLDDIEIPSLTEGLADEDPMKETLSKVEKALRATVGSKIITLNERLKAVETHAQELQKQEVVGAINQAKKKFPDFAEYRTEMLTLAQANPTLGVEDLYVLAKNRAGKLRLAETATFSEKPTSQPRRPQSRPGGNRPAEVGRASWNNTLKKALENLQLEGLGD